MKIKKSQCIYKCENISSIGCYFVCTISMIQHKAMTCDLAFTECKIVYGFISSSENF